MYLQEMVAASMVLLPPPQQRMVTARQVAWRPPWIRRLLLLVQPRLPELMLLLPEMVLQSA